MADRDPNGYDWQNGLWTITSPRRQFGGLSKSPGKGQFLFSTRQLLPHLLPRFCHTYTASFYHTYRPLPKRPLLATRTETLCRSQVLLRSRAPGEMDISSDFPPCLPRTRVFVSAGSITCIVKSTSSEASAICCAISLSHCSKRLKVRRNIRKYF